MTEENMNLIKTRCGIAASITVYDDDIKGYLEDCEADMEESGVDRSLIDAEIPGVITAATHFVKAHIGDDRSDTEKYMKMYRNKVFRLTLLDSIAQPEVENVE